MLKCPPLRLQCRPALRPSAPFRAGVQQFYDREKNDQIMIGILSQVMEIHNSESIHHIPAQRITSILPEQVRSRRPTSTAWSGMDRYLITTASASTTSAKLRYRRPHPQRPRPDAGTNRHPPHPPHSGCADAENLSQYQDEPLVKFTSASAAGTMSAGTAALSRWPEGR